MRVSRDRLRDAACLLSAVSPSQSHDGKSGKQQHLTDENVDKRATREQGDGRREVDDSSDDDGNYIGMVSSREDSHDDSVGSCRSVIAPTISSSST